ncbi:hypothetical protein B0T10DRAFT_321575 [Thelonectria olida]|uniref:Uncharacterized protein n=1 Tax=Thelonectria olida TaxID=1576542 RepID=A0A9P8W631_9HYPO|nr:hypothetical protein B0T10DRAFT_321575 [Thelonectria olida]
MGFKELFFAAFPRQLLRLLILIFALLSFALSIQAIISTARIKRCKDVPKEHDPEKTMYWVRVCSCGDWFPYLLLAGAALIWWTSAVATLFFLFAVPKEAASRIPRYVARVFAALLLISLPAFYLGWKTYGPFNKHLEIDPGSRTKATLTVAHLTFYIGIIILLLSLILDFPRSHGSDNEKSRNSSYTSRGGDTLSNA